MTAQHFQFGFIGGDVVSEGDGFRRELACRGGVEDGADAFLFGDFQGICYCTIIDFKLDDDDIRAGNDLSRLIDIRSRIGL